MPADAPFLEKELRSLLMHTYSVQLLAEESGQKEITKLLSYYIFDLIDQGRVAFDNFDGELLLLGKDAALKTAMPSSLQELECLVEEMCLPKEGDPGTWEDATHPELQPTSL